MDKKTKRREDAILAYGIAAQVAAVPEELRDEWGDIIEMP